jgi:glycerol-3-phosphate responsive antiterminator
MGLITAQLPALTRTEKHRMHLIRRSFMVHGKAEGLTLHPIKRLEQSCRYVRPGELRQRPLSALLTK